jgi:sulfatase modifying factor 1
MIARPVAPSVSLVRLAPLVAALVLSVALVAPASAGSIRGIEMEFVSIGNPGNPGDDSVVEAYYGLTGLGAVDHTYSIGKHEVTNRQWDVFLAATGGVSESVHTGPDQPANAMGIAQILRFCNWLTTGNVDRGVYEPGRVDGFLGREAAAALYGAVYYLPSLDEWYKAAYFDGSEYHLYANGTDAAPLAGIDSNYDDLFPGPWDVGTGTEEQNGTFDMMGNVSEWTDTRRPASSTWYVRGGCYGWWEGDVWHLRSSREGASTPCSYYHHARNAYMGFRVATNQPGDPEAIPEPGTIALLGIGGVILLAAGRRRRS